MTLYLWTETWPDKDEDYSCRTEDGEQVGRVYDFTVGGERFYRWFAAWPGGQTGRAETLRDASEALERAFEEMKARLSAPQT